MGFVLTFLSFIFNEYEIPSEPIKFCFELLLVVIYSIPRIIGATVSYIYFPPEPKNVEGKLILVCKYNQYLTLYNTRITVQKNIIFQKIFVNFNKY